MFTQIKKRKNKMNNVNIKIEAKFEVAEREVALF